MPKNIINTIVFVNGGPNLFFGSMLDERALCEEFGALDQGQLKSDQMSLSRYSNGRYQLAIAPDRINIQSNKDQDLLPSVLIAASQKVAGELESMKKVVPVSAVGINSDATFPAQEIGQEGKDLCNAMLTNPIAAHLMKGQSLRLASASFICLSDRVRYTIRVEPEHAVQGRDLFIGVNAHQDVTAGDSLLEKLSAIEEIREQITILHRQVLSLKER